MPELSEEDNDDPFDSLLTLEDQYYTEGYSLGVQDGTRAGLIEGRTFGLEKGFEKFLEMGRLGGKAAVWKGRLSTTTASDTTSTGLQSLSGSERLHKHIHRLHALTNAESLSTENTEDAVSAFEDRMKDATAKATLIAKILGEGDRDISSGEGQKSRTPGRSLRIRSESAKAQVAIGSGEMEDFSGLPRTSKS